MSEGIWWKVQEWRVKGEYIAWGKQEMEKGAERQENNKERPDIPSVGSGQSDLDRSRTPEVDGLGAGQRRS